MSILDLLPVLLLISAVTFFGATAILTGREIKTRQDFEMVMFAGSLNLYRYYRHVRRKGEKLTMTLRLFLWAHVGLALAMLIFVASALIKTM